MLFYGEQTLNESMNVNVNKLTKNDVFNSALLEENASIKDLAIAIYEGEDFIHEHMDILKMKDANYEITKASSINESTQLLEAAEIALNEGMGEFIGKAAEWAKKIWNSIKAFITNVWLKLTNKWEFRKRQMKDKDFLASLSMATNNPDKWDSVSLKTMPNIGNISGVTTLIASSLNDTKSPEQITELKDQIKDKFEDINETETLSGDDAIKLIPTAKALYDNNIVKQVAEVDKLEKSIAKFIDQFIKNIKSGGTKLNDYSDKKLKQSKSGKLMGTNIGPVAVLTSDRNTDDDKKNLLAEKAAVPVLAQSLHKICLAVKLNAEYQWNVLKTAARIGGYELKDLQKLK